MMVQSQQREAEDHCKFKANMVYIMKLCWGWENGEDTELAR